MCGIAGFIAPDGTHPGCGAELARMTRVLGHRGPDGEGGWRSADGRVNLGHRRLAVIDVSPTGHQPMQTAGGSVISYNGEIYNFPELRGELERGGVRFRGTSDTEVLLQALAAWGVGPALRRLNGMFAFAYWDAAARRLVLARDRFGEKPLYYSWQQGWFYFGSELKALAAHPGFRRAIDPGALAAYLRFNYVPWPHCIFRDVAKLPPGHLLEVDPAGGARPPRPYWELRDVIAARALDSRPADDAGIIDELDTVLTRAVGRRMHADVPLGAFLSGGIDSSTIVALMQKQSGRAVKTFTIGFAESAYDESGDAAAVARHLGTEHHAQAIDAGACREVIMRLGDIYDEPFADSSQIPTTLVSLFARRHVTVALSGDAGDELFAGYNRYGWGRRLWRLLGGLPVPLRSAMGGAAQGVSAAAWDRVFAAVGPVVPRRLRVRLAGDKIHKLADCVGARDLGELYRRLVSQRQDPSRLMPQVAEAPTLLDAPFVSPAGLDDIERMMYFDQLTYLPSDILTKVDRASMSASLEARVPFLDNDVVRFAWSLPVATKLNHGMGKWPLRQLLRRYVPERLFERPKTGFSLPLGEWLRGPLRGWAEELLAERSLAQHGFFDARVARREWENHLAGGRNLQHTLWPVLMFQAWMQRWQPSG